MFALVTGVQTCALPIWRLEPVPVEADIRLGRNEICYHYCPSVWLQMKTVREHHGYAGGSIGFRVAKGVTLRFGRAVPITSTREELVEKAGGELYVTNKKLRSEEHTSELQSLMRISYAVFCLKKNKTDYA